MQVREDIPVALTSIGEHAATIAMRAICSGRLYLEVNFISFFKGNEFVQNSPRMFDMGMKHFSPRHLLAASCESSVQSQGMRHMLCVSRHDLRHHAHLAWQVLNSRRRLQPPTCAHP